MSFGMITSNKNMVKKNKIVLYGDRHFIVYIKTNDIKKILQKILKLNLILQIMN